MFVARLKHPLAALVLAILCFASVLSVAQTESAVVSGRITDSTGAVITGVDVRLQSADRGTIAFAKTNEVGIYNFPSVQPGIYNLTVRKEGFRQVDFVGLAVNVQAHIQRNFELEVGAASVSITIRGDIVNLSTESPAVSTVVDQQFVSNMPLNGRSFASLILITPGVTFATASGNDSGQFSTNGQRASTNYISVDGVSANIGVNFTTAPSTPEALAGAYPGLNTLGGTNSLIPMDALQEYNIQTSTYTAELGRQPGGQVSFVTRSGTNALHGDLFEYLRNDVLDARNHFNKSPDLKPPLRQNIFGGSLGGPIFRNRTFFFFSYEGIRLRLPQSGDAEVPSIRVRTAAAASLKPILSAFPLPTGPETYWDDDDDPATPDVPSGWAPLHYHVSNPSTANTYSLRVDHTFGKMLALFVRYGDGSSESTSFNYGIGPSGAGTVASTRTFTVGINSAFSWNVNNAFRINWSRQLGQFRYVQATYGGAVPVDPALLTNGLPGEGYVAFVNGPGGGFIRGGDRAKNYQRQLNIVDSLALNKQKHLVKFGIDYRRLAPIYGTQDQQSVGFDTEQAINSAIADSVIIASSQKAKLRYPNWSIYGQDSWRASPRLTLAFGLRWEFNPAPTVTDGKMPAVLLGIVNPPDVSNATRAPQGTPFYKSFYTAFAPRLGAAYALREGAGHQTVLRGGFGVYYDLGSGTTAGGFLPMAAARLLYGVPYPLSADDAARPSIGQPNTTPLKTFANSAAQQLELPYTLQWNVALEQSFGAQQSLSLSYVGSAGRRLLTEQALNYPDDLSGQRPNPKFGFIMFAFNGPTSDYHSFQAQYRANLRRGLQALVNYTWSHAIDEVSADLESGTLRRGNASFDVRHNFSASLTYNLPAPWTNAVAKQILGNWSVDSIVHFQTGLPVDVFLSDGRIVAGEVQSLRPNVVPGQPFYIDDPSVPGGRRFNPAAFTMPPPDPANPGIPMMGNFGRNVLRGNGINQVDLALGRAFPIHEELNLVFKTEIFNVFNHPMFGNYGWYTDDPSTFGVPRTTMNVNSYSGLSPLYAPGGPRSIQFSLRLRF